MSGHYILSSHISVHPKLCQHRQTPYHNHHLQSCSQDNGCEMETSSDLIDQHTPPKVETLDVTQ